MRNLFSRLFNISLLSTGIITLPFLTSSVLSSPIPLILDDDGSQDALGGLGYLLDNPDFDLKAFTVTHGVARPENEGFQEGLKKMLGYLEATDLPVGIGSSVPLDGGVNAFPDFVRNDADNFFAPFVSFPSDEVPDITFGEAVPLLIETINNSPEPVAILATGALTNIAQALRDDPSIADNISVIQIMGGAVFVEGNLGITDSPPYSTNTVAEFNIWSDPIAADEVFRSGIPIQLAPLDGTDQLEFDRNDEQAWRDTGTPASINAANFLDFTISVVSNDVNPTSFWDLQAFINLAEPDFSNEVPLHIQIDVSPDPGGTQGRTEAIDGLPPNTLVSFDQSFDNLPYSSQELFSNLQPSQTIPEPTTLLSSLAVLGLVGVIRRGKKSKTF